MSIVKYNMMTDLLKDEDLIIKKEREIEDDYNAKLKSIDDQFNKAIDYDYHNHYLVVLKDVLYTIENINLYINSRYNEYNYHSNITQLRFEEQLIDENSSINLENTLLLVNQFFDFVTNRFDYKNDKSRTYLGHKILEVYTLIKYTVDNFTDIFSEFFNEKAFEKTAKSIHNIAVNDPKIELEMEQYSIKSEKDKIAARMKSIINNSINEINQRKPSKLIKVDNENKSNFVENVQIGTFKPNFNNDQRLKNLEIPFELNVIDQLSNLYVEWDGKKDNSLVQNLIRNISLSVFANYKFNSSKIIVSTLEMDNALYGRLGELSVFGNNLEIINDSEQFENTLNEIKNLNAKRAQKFGYLTNLGLTENINNYNKENPDDQQESIFIVIHNYPKGYNNKQTTLIKQLLNSTAYGIYFVLINNISVNQDETEIKSYLSLINEIKKHKIIKVVGDKVIYDGFEVDVFYDKGGFDFDFVKNYFEKQN